MSNLGAMTVLSSDKTGTLTKDEITLRHYVEYTGKPNTDVLKLVTVDSVVQGSNGNNIDGATIEHRMADGRSINTAQYEKVAAIPLNFERHRSACIVKRATRTNLLIVKGAFEEVLRLCSTVRQGGVAVPLDFQKKEMLVTRTNRLNREGFRALLVDLRDEDSLQELETNMVLEGYGLGGILSIIDPPKDDAAQSIVELKDLGVQTESLPVIHSP
ncbi:hypothetical protein E4U45_001838 [Claviceps purpurea]|nr:hypothetical protein E4U45_001838 [Claviceps purpurea]